MVKTKTKEIIKEWQYLKQRANNLNPSFKPAGTNASWDDYYKALEDIKKFENKEW